ncbi:MAG: insulinase family protein [Prevotellaceae bacterium]|jgi:predicted Zn-dependent peptidase|nr:insulinase family protein [Prevotellaceae bacterium]
METCQLTLPNGLRIVHRQNRSNVVYCGLTINAGSRDETLAEHGIAHFIEHMLFKGTKKYSAHLINNRLENVGGELNAFTAKEETVVHATILKNDLGKALELMADMAFNPTFPPKEFEKEKLVILDEINAYKDNPAEQIFDDFEERLFAQTSVGRSILGSEQSLTSLVPPQLFQFATQYYHPQNMILSIVGKISAKRIEQLSCKYFGGFVARDQAHNRTTPGLYTPFHILQSRNTYQAHCMLGNRAYSLYHPKRVAMSLFANYLGGPASNSLLNTLLREKHGLVYTVEANYSPYADCGAFSIYFGTDKEKVQKCRDIISAAFNKLREIPLEERVLQRIKKQLIGQLAIATDNAESQMISQAKSMLAFNKVETSEQIKEKINAVTAIELQEIAEETLHPDRLSTLIYT